MAENEFLDEGEESECGTITEIRNVAKCEGRPKRVLQNQRRTAYRE